MAKERTEKLVGGEGEEDLFRELLSLSPLPRKSRFSEKSGGEGGRSLMDM